MAGKMIYDARKARNLTHRELAALVGVTQGHLSQIERDRIDPSLSVLIKLSQVLDIPLSTMFEENSADDYFLSRADKRSRITWHDGSMSYQFLTPDIRISSIRPEMDMVSVTLGPFAQAGGGIMPENCEEFLFMTEGQIEYGNGQGRFTVLESECVYTANNTGFTIRNITEKPAAFLWATVPVATMNGPVPQGGKKSRGAGKDDESASLLGGRIRALRLAQKMKTIDLANAIGVSAAHISRLEHNQMNPSLVVLRRISEVLKVSLPNLFSEQVGRDKVFKTVKKKSHMHLDDSQYYDYFLTPSLIAREGKVHLLTAYLSVIKGKNAGRDDLVIHSGPEITYVLKGDVQIHLHNDKIVPMSQGDCLYMERAVPHKACNAGSDDAELLHLAI